MGFVEPRRRNDGGKQILSTRALTLHTHVPGPAFAPTPAHVSCLSTTLSPSSSSFVPSDRTYPVAAVVQPSLPRMPAVDEQLPADVAQPICAVQMVHGFVHSPFTKAGTPSYSGVLHSQVPVPATCSPGYQWPKTNVEIVSGLQGRLDAHEPSARKGVRGRRKRRGGRTTTTEQPAERYAPH